MNIPIAGQTLPEDDFIVVVGDGDHPGVWLILGLGAHTDIRVQAEAEQQIAKQDRMGLAVATIFDQERVQMKPLLGLLIDAKRGSHLIIANQAHKS